MSKLWMGVVPDPEATRAIAPADSATATSESSGSAYAVAGAEVVAAG